MVLFSPFSHHDSSNPAARSLSQVGSDFIGFGENSTKVPKIGTQKIGRNGISIFKRKSKKNFAAQWLEINLKKSHFYRFIMEGLHLCWPALMDTKMLFNCCPTILTDFPPLCSEQETTVNTQMSQFSFGNDSGGKSF